MDRGEMSGKAAGTGDDQADEGVEMDTSMVSATHDDDHPPSSSSSAAPSTDVISQLESDLALMLQIMSSSLHYISNRSAHVQLNNVVPLFQPISSASVTASKQLVDVEQMYESIEELSDDLVGKAKDMEKLVHSLPRQRNEETVKSELRAIDEQMGSANAEYRHALNEAKVLQKELYSLLRHLCDDHQAGRAKLAASAFEDETVLEQKKEEI